MRRGHIGVLIGCVAGVGLFSPVTQAQELQSALKASNQNVWYLEFGEANHDNLGLVGGDYLLSAWMWFFRNFLLN